MGPAHAVVETEHLGKSFGSGVKEVQAVTDLNLAVEQGEIFGFLGPNGAGKTTTLRMLSTLLRIGSGRAVVAGHDVAKSPRKVRERIGYVSQLGGANPQATGWDNLILQGMLYGDSRKSVIARAGELMAALEIEEFAKRKVITYSGGQKRRLDIAMGIIHRPEVLFLDEPTTGLDPQNRANMWSQIRKLRDGGTTVFLTTHYLEEADALADRISIMDHGSIIADGTPSELKGQIGGDAITIEIAESASGEAVMHTLSSISELHSIAQDGLRIHCYANGGTRILPQVIRTLDEAKVAIESIAVAQPSLDDVFLKFTGHSLRDTKVEKEGGA